MNLKLLRFEMLMLMLYQKCSADQAIALVARQFNLTGDEEQELSTYFNKHADLARAEFKQRQELKNALT